MEHFIVRNISDDHYKTRTGLSWTTINSVIYVRVSSGFGQIQLFYGLRFFCSPTKRGFLQQDIFVLDLDLKLMKGRTLENPLKNYELACFETV